MIQFVNGPAGATHAAPSRAAVKVPARVHTASAATAAAPAEPESDVIPAGPRAIRASRPTHRPVTQVRTTPATAVPDRPARPPAQRPAQRPARPPARPPARLLAPRRRLPVRRPVRCPRPRRAPATRRRPQLHPPRRRPPHRSADSLRRIARPDPSHPAGSRGLHPSHPADRGPGPRGQLAAREVQAGTRIQQAPSLFHAPDGPPGTSL